jgi:digeranylgeranylglycerophospholipid reductase
MFDYDVIVVGCGPAGLMAATELKKSGINVLGIDKKPDVSKNFRSASGYFITDQEFNGEFVRLEPIDKKTRIHFTHCGFYIDYTGSMEGIYHTHIVSQSGRHLQISKTKSPLFYLFEPTHWLSDRHRAAQQAGVSINTSTLCLKVKELPEGVELTVRKNGLTKTITCRKLLASDGLQSRIASYLGFNRERAIFGKGCTVEYEMDNVDVPFARGDIYIFGEKNVGSTAAVIMIPSMAGEKAYRIETLSPIPAESASKIMEFFTQQGALSPWFKKAKLLDTTGAIVGIGESIKIPYKGNVLLVSDAAAFAECMYQGATMCGYMAAQAVIKELSGQNGFEEYTGWWNSTFEWNRNPLRMADYTKRSLLNRFLTPAEVDYLFDRGAQKPLVAEEMEANPYDYTNALVDYFLTIPDLPQPLIEKLKIMRTADMSTWANLVAKAREKMAN